MNNDFQNPLTRNKEKLIKSLHRKKERRETGLCVCEGMRACSQLYELRPDLIQFGVYVHGVDISSFRDIPFFTAGLETFGRIADTLNSQGILFAVRIPEPEGFTKENTPFILVLDRISDPGNFGTILRTCASVGLKDVWYSEGSADPYSDKTIRAAMSAQFSLKLHEYCNLPSLIEKLKGNGYINIFRTDPLSGISCFEEERLFDNSVIVFGNEAHGVGEFSTASSVNIPMPGRFESLNVAQAVTVILFDAVRRKILN